MRTAAEKRARLREVSARLAARLQLSGGVLAASSGGPLL
jgi:hypothetical protein